MSVSINVINIDDSILNRMKELKMTKVQFAQNMDIRESNVNRKIKQIKKNLDELICVCGILDYNFFKDFIPDEENKEVSKEVSPEPNPNYIVDKALELAAANARLQNELDKLKQELTKYKDKEQNNKKEGIAS